VFPGSPFQFTVGPITDGGSHKVRAVGLGLERGEVNKPCMYNKSIKAIVQYEFIFQSTVGP
jgi:hypothetical protein